jgi:hypothetical protein
VIERKYLEMFERLRKDPSAPAAEPLPGWLARRKKTLPAAAGVVGRAPSGPVVK